MPIDLDRRLTSRSCYALAHEGPPSISWRHLYEGRLIPQQVLLVCNNLEYDNSPIFTGSAEPENSHLCLVAQIGAEPSRARQRLFELANSQSLLSLK